MARNVITAHISNPSSNRQGIVIISRIPNKKPIVVKKSMAPAAQPQLIGNPFAPVWQPGTDEISSWLTNIIASHIANAVIDQRIKLLLSGRILGRYKGALLFQHAGD